MAEDIEKVIYKLELDGSAYIQGVESLSASTRKLTTEQEKANKALKDAENNLKNQAAYFQQAKKDLEAYSGSNEKYRTQLKKSFDTAQADNQKLTEIVNSNRKAYESATKAAQDFANTSAKATNLQSQTGGKIPTGPGNTSAITSQIAGVLNVADFTKQALIIEQTQKEFDDLKTSIGLAEQRMQQLNATDEEFKQLKPIVEQGKEAIKQYDIATKGAGDSTSSLRTQLRLGREELVKLEQAGKGATKEYFTLEKQVAKLTDEFGDQQARIKTLASDTKLLDFGKGAITAATSAFQAYTAVSVLVGDDNEELQKKTMQLFAAMQLLQSLEQLSNLTRREGVLATLAGSAAQSVYTAVVGASTGALKAFRIALASTGILAAVIAIGFLVNKWIELRAAQEKAAISQKALLDINTKAVDSYAEEVTHLKLLSAEYNTVNTSAARKKEIQDELQKSYPSYFADLDKHADKEKYIAEQTDKVTEAIKLQAKIQAGQSLLAEKYKEVLKQQFDPKSAVTFGDKLVASLKHATDEAAKSEVDRVAASKVSKALKEYETLETFITNTNIENQKKLDALGGDPHKQPEKEKTEKKIKEIQNDFEKKKAELDAKLSALKAKEAIDEQAIRAQFAAALRKEQVEIDKNKNLTKPQKIILKNELVDINKIELDKALSDFRKKIVDARKKLNDELTGIQNKATEDTINLIQNEFERRAALIDFSEKKEIAAAYDTTTTKLTDLERQHNDGLISEKQYQRVKAELISVGSQQELNIIQEAANKRKDLSADIFQNLLNSYTSAIANADLVFSEDEAKAIRSLADKFLAGKITYEKYQKELTKIEKKAAKDRLEGELVTQTAKLAALDRELAAIEDKYSSHYKKLKDQRDQQAEKVANLTKANAKTDVDDPVKKQVETVQQYAEAIGQVADSVIAFWQAANDAESKALDRSISLQEKRVSAAQKIADRGNAEYLKAEEDRLTELNIKRENAARRQLGIDAALQASQLLVGITGAIAKIATPGIGIAETIAAMAVIVGSLAAGYGIVKSLQGNVPKLFVGTTDTGTGGKEDSKGGFTATLHPHEAVIPADKNKAYHPTVAAIYDGTIPAEHLNNFVNHYHKIKAVPQPNYERIREAAELHIGQDGRMSVLLTENNKKLDEHIELQKLTLRAMKNMSVSANIDRNGVAIAVNEYVEQMKIDKKL